MNNSKTNYSLVLKNLSKKDWINEELKAICTSYSNILESGNYKDEDILISDFLTDVSASNATQSSKDSIISKFKMHRLSNLGLKESYNFVIEKFEHQNLPLFKERLNLVKQLSEKKEDYLNIDRVIDIYKSLGSHSLLEEQIQILENNKMKFGEDIRVSNIINYLKSSPDYNKYKANFNKCISALEAYLMEPQGSTRQAALNCLRTEISYDNVVKDFMNYLVSLNFSDHTYGNHHDYGENSSLATERTYSGGSLERWFHGKENSGLGKIVLESLKDAIEVKKLSNERIALKLILERLKNDITSYNRDEKKLYTELKEEYSSYDLGLLDAIDVLSENKKISGFPLFKEVSKLVYEGIDSGISDRKIINEVYNKLSKLNFDSDVVDVLNKLQERFELNKENIIIQNALEYISENNKLGLYNSLKEHLVEYKKNKDPQKRKFIVEKYSSLINDSNIRNMLGSLGQLDSSPNSIVNSNPQDFVITPEYSVYEIKNGKEYFVLNGNYMIREDNHIYHIKEEKTTETVSKVNRLLEYFDCNILKNKIVGKFDQKDHFEISYNSLNETFLNVNGNPINEDNKYNYIHTKESRRGGSEIRKVLELKENSSSIVEMDYINTISYKKDPKIRASLINLNGEFTINFVNENTGLNKIVKTKKYSTLKSVLLEYMRFDISSTFANELKIEKDELDKLEEKSMKMYSSILESEENLEKIENLILGLTDAKLIQSGMEITESLRFEIDESKKEYRNLLSLIEKNK